MQTASYCLKKVAKNFDFCKRSVFFRFFLWAGFLLAYGSFNAQESDSIRKVSPATVVVTGDAKIYSTDPNFNRQFITHKVILKKGQLSFRKNFNKENSLQVISSDSKKNLSDFKTALKVAKTKKRIEELEIEKQIEKYENRKETFEKFDFKGFPSPDVFFASNIILKSYVAPGDNNHDFTKIHPAEKYNSATYSLEFLYSQKYVFYNSRSFDFCFSKVFSVRPPPLSI